ncbi:MAG: hypothetical protein ABI180_05890 [Microcoleus sp.]
MQKILAAQFAGKLTGTAAVGGDRRNGRDDQAIAARSAAKV